MTYAFYICVSLGLIVLQTTIFPLFPILNDFFDLLLPLIVYVGFFRSVREGIIIVVIMGTSMDSISGIFFGRFLTSYLWLFIASQWLKQFLQINNYFLLSLVMILGILIETAAIIIMGGPFATDWDALKIVMVQLFFAATAGPLIIKLIKYFHEKWNKTLHGIISAENNDFE